MARRRKNILIDLIGKVIFFGFLFFYVIPKFQQTVMDTSQQMLNQSMQD